MTATAQSEPLVTITFGQNQITLLGTAHISRASAEKVSELLASGDYDAVALELCASRYNSLLNPAALAKLDLFEVLRTGKAPMVAASLALGAYQQRLAEQFGVEPGVEMRAAIESARTRQLPVLLIDREIGVTLKRIYRSVPWWRGVYLLAGLLASLFSSEKVTEAEVERLKQGDVLEATFTQFSDKQRDLYIPLIDERDRYMAARLRQEMARGNYGHILAVIGAGHLRGIQKYLHDDSAPPAQVMATLEQMPPPKAGFKWFSWLVVLVILAGFGIGFSQSPALGWRLVLDWVLISGGLAALGAVLAAAHPLTVLSAFLAAPITTLHPALGVGMVTAAVEIYLRKPTLGDFSQLRKDTARLQGWRHNRVAHALLVFILSSLGAVIGTYVAGWRIVERLAGA